MFAVTDRIRRSLVANGLKINARPHYRRLLDAVGDPASAQRTVLRDIVARNAETAFGRKHGFAKIESAEEFRDAIAVQSYEDLRPFIECQERTGEPSLTADRPVYYNRTSGTTGQPKNIPLTPSGINRIKRQQQIFALAQSRGSRFLDGKIFAVTGQAVEGRMPGGALYGSASGLLYRNQPGLIRSRYVLPYAVSEIDDYETRYFVMAALGLSERCVTGIATANPSTLAKLLSVINARTEELLETVATGRLGTALPADIDLTSRLRARPDRAAELSDLYQCAGALTYRDIWPGLDAVATWTGGSCGIALKSLSQSFSPDCRFVELGYLASEMRGTLNIDIANNTCLPTLLDTYFEFVDRDQWETGAVAFLGLHEVETGREYYVFVTTPDGLYRYDMNDIVRVTGSYDRTPCFEFVQKGRGITNITGEKLYEIQVINAVVDTLADAKLDTAFFIVLADRETAAYTLYLESDGSNASTELIAKNIDARLGGANIEYRAKRDSGRLMPMNVEWLRPGTGNDYRTDRVTNGQRDAQFKHLHLQYAHECDFAFDRAVVGRYC